MPIVLPHDILNALHHCGRLQELAGLDDIKQFWDHYRDHISDDIQWPVGAPDGAVPLGMHGDDSRFTDSGQKLLVLSLNILHDPTKARFPLVAIRHAAGPVYKARICR